MQHDFQIELIMYSIFFKKKTYLIMFIFIVGSVRPFRLSFHTNAVEMPNDMGNRGFCLNYIQQPCNANYK